MNEETTDDLLIAAAKEGHTEAFLLLFGRYHTPIFRFLYRFLGSEEAAEDITHDCFLDLVRKPEDYKTRHASLLLQLYGRARNLAMAHLHHLEERRHGHLHAEDQRGHMGEQRHHAEVRGKSIVTVKQAISGLPPLERETLILFEYEGLPVNDIATIVEANGEIVAARLETARQRLRTVLSRYLS